MVLSQDIVPLLWRISALVSKLQWWFDCRFAVRVMCFKRSAEVLLPGSRFHRYYRDGLSQIRSSAPYAVPDDVHQHLDFGLNLLR